MDIYSPLLELVTWGPQQVFGGMRDLANFCADIRDGSWKQEREAGILIKVIPSK